MRSLITIQQRFENGYVFSRSGLKTGVENGIFWSEIGSGLGEPGGTPLPKIPRSTPPGYYRFYVNHQECYGMLFWFAT